MSGKIKCSYEDCFKHFASYEAMKKHKAKDSAHDSYCKKCDLDCNDDIEYLYHQITSQRHMACPICGREFQSEGGRDRHVEIEHVPKQNISCVGCQTKFDRAATLMAHIERDECKVIRVQHFQRQKAEHQIAQDAWDAALDPTAGATILSNARSYATTSNEMNLLDDERAYVNTDWQGRPQFDETNEQNGPYVGPPTDSMSNLSISKFPPLGPQNRVEPDHLPLVTDPATASRTQQNPFPAGGAWGFGTNSASHLFTTKSNNKTDIKVETTPVNDTASINLLDTFTDDDLTNHDCASTLSRASHMAQNSSTTAPIPPSARALNQDPNFANRQLKTTTPFSSPSTLSAQSFHDPVLNKYICPSMTCGAHFTSPQAFHAHLLRPPHTGGQVSCPGCYKKFKTTTALLTHCESGSRKCRIRNSLDYDRVVRQITAGILGIDGTTAEGGIRYVARDVTQW